MAKYFEKYKYIEREKAVQACVSMRKEVTDMMRGEGPFHTEDAKKIGNLLKKFETQVSAVSSSDVVPVVHGRWEDHREWDLKSMSYFLAGYQCSCCAYWYVNPNKYTYCPSCGARMDMDGE